MNSLPKISAHVAGIAGPAVTHGIGQRSSRADGEPPKVCCFSVGPTGVGKGVWAKPLAELVVGNDEPLKVFDMAEYQLEPAVTTSGSSRCPKNSTLNNGSAVRHALEALRASMRPRTVTQFSGPSAGCACPRCGFTYGVVRVNTGIHCNHCGDDGM